MRNRYDQLSKFLMRDALAVGGQLHPQHEIATEVQATDGWFVPDAARATNLAARGLLGRLFSGVPALLEPFHEPPDVDEIRACIHKQLAADLLRLREAERRRSRPPRPPFPLLWVISGGRPETVLSKYGFTEIPEWPSGCFQRCEADAFGLIVIPDLPRERDTLILRLMGRKEVQAGALEDLQRLEEDAWEREVALKHLLAFRFETPKDGSDEDREYLMNTEEIYATWLKRTQDEARGKALDEGKKLGLDEGKRQGIDEGKRQGLRRNICAVYEARLGPMPEALRVVVDATDDMAQLEAWVVLVAIGSAGEIAEALAGGKRRD
mgnify:CR=1 FL=1